MIWVSWRQHRSQAIGCLAVLAGLAIYAILLGTSMRTAYGQDNLAGCQTVPRARWLTVKLALVTGGLVVVGAVMTAVITWYRTPMDRFTGRFLHNIYDFEGLVPTAYILCAFGFAVLAGLLIRRSIPAMIAAFVPWLAIRLVVEFLLRPNFMAPLKIACSATPGRCSGHGNGGTGISAIPPATGHIGDWVLSAFGGRSGNVITYQPAGRFWAFQGIEAGIFVALTAAALGLRSGCCTAAPPGRLRFTERWPPERRPPRTHAGQRCRGLRRSRRWSVLLNVYLW